MQGNCGPDGGDYSTIRLDPVFVETVKLITEGDSAHRVLTGKFGYRFRGRGSSQNAEIACWMDMWF